VHCHPDDAFAGRHLGRPHGKTEAWAVLEAEPGATVHIGLRAAVDEAALAALVRGQDAAALVGALVPVPVRPGDTVLVPAGLPHSVGAGILLLELQQPSDLSLLLERTGFPGAGTGDLGLGDRTALGCVDRSAWDRDRVAGLLGRVEAGDALPAAAAPFLRLDRVLATEPVELTAGFAVLVVTAGAGRLESPTGALAVRRGTTVLVPHAAGPVRLAGDGGPVEILRCRPPAPGGGPAARGTA
jgi:mannose-6-phosphate isomerase